MINFKILAYNFIIFDTCQKNPQYFPLPIKSNHNLKKYFVADKTEFATHTHIHIPKYVAQAHAHSIP